MSNILDTFALNYGNVVLRDGNNKASIFVRHPKQNSSEFDASLPNHVHPAFQYGADTEDDAVLIGKYKNSEYEKNGPLYSIPNGRLTEATDRSDRTRTYDNCLTSMRSFGSDVTGMTIADHGLLVLMAHKKGLALHGNTSFGNDANDGTTLVLNTACSVNAKYCYMGWEYKCVKAIASLTAALTPDQAPAYWEKIRKVGGTLTESTVGDDGVRHAYTLAGSGPVEWYLNHDIAMEADLVGGSSENVYGMRLKNGEIQIIPNNQSADPTSDHGANSALWRAIKPTGNGAYEYVAVNSDEANTLHYAPVGGKVTLVKRALTSAELSAGNVNTVFKNMTVEASSITLENVPTIMYELGLFPISGTTVNGMMRVTFDSGEHVPRSGDSYDSRNRDAGIASLVFQYTRGAAIGTLSGSRMRSRIPAST